MDWIYAFTKSTHIKINKLLPLYRGEKIEILTNGNELIFSRNGTIRLNAKIY
ncbi:MAG: hypothetical protein WC758_03225 [Candidatus Woesearchaeota archaeon]|jgi:hypothetical protein